jgi:hypothetical protein
MPSIYEQTDAGKTVEVAGLKIQAALGREAYPAIAEKVKKFNTPNYWYYPKPASPAGSPPDEGEPTRRCANNYLTWAEFECWRKWKVTL